MSGADDGQSPADRVRIALQGISSSDGSAARASPTTSEGWLTLEGPPPPGANAPAEGGGGGRDTTGGRALPSEMRDGREMEREQPGNAPPQLNAAARQQLAWTSMFSTRDAMCQEDYRLVKFNQCLYCEGEKEITLRVRIPLGGGRHDYENLDVNRLCRSWRSTSATADGISCPNHTGLARRYEHPLREGQIYVQVYKDGNEIYVLRNGPWISTAEYKALPKSRPVKGDISSGEDPEPESPQGDDRRSRAFEPAQPGPPFNSAPRVRSPLSRSP